MKRIALLALVLSLGMGSAAVAQQTNPGETFLLNWDSDSDGVVTLAEVQTRRADLFTAFDANEDGQLDDAEFAVIDETRTANQDANRQANMDANAALQQGRGGGKGQGGGMGGMGRAEDPVAERAAIDTNGDGLVSRDEFAAGSDLWFGMRDRNGDGILTTADFGRG